MTDFLRKIAFLFCSFLVCATASGEERSLLLIIKPASEELVSSAKEGSDPLLADSIHQRLVVGLVNFPSFAVQNIQNITLDDPEGKVVPLLIDKSSLYSEFNDTTINSMRIAFLTDEQTIKKGSFRLVWGSEIKAENKEVGQITICASSKDAYREFQWEEQPQKDGLSNYSASLDVIVDDKADTYYLWYLLPVALIFGMLIVRRLTMQ